jgi:hypothetical protein
LSPEARTSGLFPGSVTSGPAFAGNAWGFSKTAATKRKGYSCPLSTCQAKRLAPATQKTTIPVTATIVQATGS